jgi:hypothetical protein
LNNAPLYTESGKPGRLRIGVAAAARDYLPRRWSSKTPTRVFVPKPPAGEQRSLTLIIQHRVDIGSTPLTFTVPVRDKPAHEHPATTLAAGGLPPRSANVALAAGGRSAPR